MAITSYSLLYAADEWINPFRKEKDEEKHLSQKFQNALLLIVFLLTIANVFMTYYFQSQSAYKMHHMY